jgi:hypothetical protein
MSGREPMTSEPSSTQSTDPRSQWPTPAIATEGGDLGRDDAFVDADDDVFEGFGDAPDPTDVAVVEIGGDPSLTLPPGRAGGGKGGGFVGYFDGRA